MAGRSIPNSVHTVIGFASLVIGQLQHHLAEGVGAALDALHEVLAVLPEVEDLDVGRRVQPLELGDGLGDPLPERLVQRPLDLQDPQGRDAVRRGLLRLDITFSH